jgi:uncharacterized protein YecT (DUF1311 family)
MRIRALLFAMAALVSSPAAAEDKWVCDDAPDNATHRECSDREFRKYDAELNRLYAVLLKDAASMNEPQRGYGPPPVQALREAQRAWVAYRDANCHWKSTAFYGGSGQSVILSSCRAIATRDRVEEFKQFQQD